MFFLYIFFVVNLGLFAYFFFNGIFSLEREIKLWHCIGGVGLIYLARYFFTQYQLLFIKARKELRQFYFTIVIFNIFIGLVIFPLNAFAAFASSVSGGVAMYIGLFMVVAIYLLRQFRGLFIGSKFLINNQFHFFIYLCTVEIAPMVILGKFFISIFF
nr:DUF4271 domain-containing protein [Saprospiraceae bacterium]